MELSKQEKKDLLKKWKAEQDKKYCLSKAKVRQLFRFLEKQLRTTPCDHSLRHTEQWICEHCPPEKKESILHEIREMGGFCDCEVLLNCYERYNLP